MAATGRLRGRGAELRLQDAEGSTLCVEDFSDPLQFSLLPRGPELDGSVAAIAKREQKVKVFALESLERILVMVNAVGLFLAKVAVGAFRRIHQRPHFRPQRAGKVVPVAPEPQVAQQVVAVFVGRAEPQRRPGSPRKSLPPFRCKPLPFLGLLASAGCTQRWSPEVFPKQAAWLDPGGMSPPKPPKGRVGEQGALGFSAESVLASPSVIFQAPAWKPPGAAPHEESRRSTPFALSSVSIGMAPPSGSPGVVRIVAPIDPRTSTGGQRCRQPGKEGPRYVDQDS